MINRLPALDDPVRYKGLYLFDFGTHVAVGYTAEEIAILLAEPAYVSAKVYKIRQARPDGTLEICGVNTARWSRTTGLVFWFNDFAQADAGFNDLIRRAQKLAPPGTIAVSLSHGSARRPGCAVVLRYLMVLDEAVSAWLLTLDYNPGAIVELGTSAVDQAITDAEKIGNAELGPADRYRSRSREEVLAGVDMPVQR